MVGSRDTGNHFDSWNKIEDLMGPRLFITDTKKTIHSEELLVAKPNL